MFKKISIIIAIVIGLIVLSFNVYKLTFYKEFKNHLSEKYPEKRFILYWVKYDFIYNKFYATVYCKSDGTDFYIRNDRGVISEEYLERRNNKNMNKVITSYLEKEDIYQYIKSVNVGVENKEALNQNLDIDLEGIEKAIYVYFYEDKIKDSQHIADVSYKIINILKKNQVNFNKASFAAEIDAGVYELRLEGEEIFKEAKEIFVLVKRIK